MRVGVASLHRFYGWEVLVRQGATTFSAPSVSASSEAAGYISAPIARAVEVATATRYRCGDSR